jgi:hypothetical protein
MIQPLAALRHVAMVLASFLEGRRSVLGVYVARSGRKVAMLRFLPNAEDVYGKIFRRNTRIGGLSGDIRGFGGNGESGQWVEAARS